jgi:hypothetical protein
MEYETSKEEKYSIIRELILKDRVDQVWEYYGRANAEVIRYDYRRKGEV